MRLGEVPQANQSFILDQEARQRVTPNDHAQAASQGSLIAIVTVSDTRTPETDTSGKTIRKLVEEAGHRVTGYRIVRDEPDEVRDVLKRFTDGRARLVIFNGGTGISQRDRTYDVISKALEKTLPGFGELFRMLSFQRGGRGGDVKSRPRASIVTRWSLARRVHPMPCRLPWKSSFCQRFSTWRGSWVAR